MLLEGWDPFPVDERSRGSRDDEEVATQNVRGLVLLRLARKRARWFKSQVGWESRIVDAGSDSASASFGFSKKASRAFSFEMSAAYRTA